MTYATKVVLAKVAAGTGITVLGSLIVGGIQKGIESNVSDTIDVCDEALDKIYPEKKTKVKVKGKFRKQTVTKREFDPDGFKNVFGLDQDDTKKKTKH